MPFPALTVKLSKYNVDDVSLGVCKKVFYSSRRRHTRYIGDWSSDVCSSDLQQKVIPLVLKKQDVMARAQTGSGKSASFVLPILEDRKSVVEGKSVDIGG